MRFKSNAAKNTLSAKLKRFSVTVTILLLSLTIINIVTNHQTTERIVQLNTRVLPNQFALQDMLSHMTQVHLLLVAYLIGDLSQIDNIHGELSRYRSARNQYSEAAVSENAARELDSRFNELNDYISELLLKAQSPELTRTKTYLVVSGTSVFTRAGEVTEVNRRYFDQITTLILALQSASHQESTETTQALKSMQNLAQRIHIVLAAAFFMTLFWFYRYLQTAMISPVALIVDNINRLSRFERPRALSTSLLSDEYLQIGKSIQQLHAHLVELEQFQKQKLDETEREHFSQIKLLVEDLEQFIHIASHDLRAPLNKIHALCEIMHEPGEVIPEDERILLSEKMKKECQNAVKLLGDLCNFTYAGSDSAENSPVDMGFLLRSMISKRESELKETNATTEIDSESDFSLMGSELLIRQLIDNLLQNAIKYGGSGVHISFKQLPDNEEGYRVFCFSNTMQETRKIGDNLLRPFVRGDNHRQEGTGMGLAICKRVVKRHQGEMWIDSRQPQIFSVVFSLPRSTNEN